MITKIYRYSLAENKWPEFLLLQKKVDKVYSKYVSYHVSFVRDLQNPSKITEIHNYPDLENVKKAEDLHKIEPSVNDLFRQFITLLDPSKKDISEEMGEAFRVRD